MKILGRFKEKLFEEDFKKTLLNNLSKLRSKLNKSSKIIVELKSKGESRILYFMGKVIFSFNCNYVGDIDFELLRSIYTLRNAAYQYLILPSLLILFIILVSIPYGFSGASATMIASSLLVLSQTLNISVYIPLQRPLFLSLLKYVKMRSIQALLEDLYR